MRGSDGRVEVVSVEITDFSCFVRVAGWDLAALKNVFFFSGSLTHLSLSISLSSSSSSSFICDAHINGHTLFLSLFHLQCTH